MVSSPESDFSLDKTILASCQESDFDPDKTILVLYPKSNFGPDRTISVSYPISDFDFDPSAIVKQLSRILYMSCLNVIGIIIHFKLSFAIVGS